MRTRGVTPRPLQLKTAMRAMGALIDDPDDTAQVFRIIRALSGNSFERLFQRVLADPVGSRILNERRDILPVLQDRDRLRQLPEGTLGREYARFLDQEGISAEGLVEASDGFDDSVFLDDRAELLSRRLRDIHDLWHVVTGYQRDLFGEVALLAFTYAQIRNGGIGFIVLIAMLKEWREGYRDGLALSRGAYFRGRRAGFFAAADWEALLERPLAEVRRELGVTELAPYTPLFSAEAAAAS
ncbi:MAG TPA: Coq4 family protein [Candidatus Limnocylindrales bacterium]|nr:Coq4 family protein [Candidatus Limnocylindrales bacterium]